MTSPTDIRQARSRTVGIVEDSEATRDFLRVLLEERGYEVQCYASLEDARCALDAPPGLMIVDVLLGDGSGLTLVRELRQRFTARQVPVVVLSGRSREVDLLEGYEAGANEYLTKPFLNTELLAKCGLLLPPRGSPRSTPLEPERVGLTFQRYVLREVIGEGKFAVVHRAHDTHDGLDVALKILHVDHSASPEQRQRFLRESYTLSLLNDPRVVSVLDFGEQEGRLYCAMELVQGCTLRAFVRERRALSGDEAWGLLLGLARALRALHQARLVHRDLKPSNVMLRDDRPTEPVLIDFGLAKRVDDHMLTAPGNILGTPSFMSPEAIRNEQPDHRSDLFCLGLVVRFALLREGVFPDRSGLDVLMAMLTRPIEIPTSVAPPLRDVLLRVTQREPEDRYRSAQELLADLSEPGSRDH